MWRIAWRYLWGGKRYAAVNVITAVSVAGVAVATAAIIIVLSVFNGFRDVARGQLAAVDPDVRVTALRGVIADADSVVRVLQTLPQVHAAAAMLEQRGLIVGDNIQTPVRWRGVDADAYQRVTTLDSTIIDGLWLPGMASLSVGVAVAAQARPGGVVALYVPRRMGRITPANAYTAFHGDTLMVGSVIRTGQQDYDADMMYIPIDEARRLLDYYGAEATSVEVAIDGNGAISAITAALGPSYIVTPRQGLEKDSMRLIAVEKWITFAMLAFILLIASFNVISTLVMLVLEKRHDAWTLAALGLGPGQLADIFVWQGRYIAAGGCLLGLTLGAGLCLLQQHCHIVRLAADPATTAIDYYPVTLEGWDMLVVAALSIGVSLLATRVALRLAPPARNASKG